MHIYLEDSIYQAMEQKIHASMLSEHISTMCNGFT